MYKDTFFLPLSLSLRALRLAGEEVEETELPALVTDQQTFYCSNVIGNAIIQVMKIMMIIIVQLFYLFSTCKYE